MSELAPRLFFDDGPVFVLLMIGRELVQFPTV